jgi:hypothetical protein
MAVLKDVELWFARLDPKNPNSLFDKDNPTWEVQIRTKDKNQMQDWKSLNLKPKLEQDENNGTYWKVNLKRKSKKKDGTPLSPVKVVDGALEDVDPNTIGNGSIGDVRIFQYDYEVGVGKVKKSGVASMLAAIQLSKHIVYIRQKSEDDFSMRDTEVVMPDQNLATDPDDEDAAY